MSRRWRWSPTGAARSPADLLRDADLTLTAVARRVGYGSPFALSAAFERLRGVSPQAYRETA